MAFQIFSFVVGVSIADIHKYVLDKYVGPLFGVKRGDPRYDSRADVNGDGVIDMRDLGTFSRDVNLTFATFGITPVLWWQAAIPIGVVAVGGIAAYAYLRKR